MSYKENYEKALYILELYCDRYEDDATVEEWKKIIEEHTLEELKKVGEANEE